MKVSVLSPLSPSEILGELIDKTGLSSLLIVPVAVIDVALPGKDAFVGLLNFTITVSFGSVSVSPAIETSMFLLVSPAAKFSVSAASVE